MRVIAPNTYVIKFEEKDNKTMTDCMELLTEIASTMARLNCEILSTHYGTVIKIHEVETVIDTLETLKYVETIREK